MIFGAKDPMQILCFYVHCVVMDNLYKLEDELFH